MNVASLLQMAVAVLWIIVIGLIVLAVVRSSRGQKVRVTSTSVAVVALVAILLTIVSSGMVFIQPNERGVVISALAPRGYREQALEPGLRWVIPFFENVVPYSISKQSYTMSILTSEGNIQGDDSITARTLDGQEIFMDASVIYTINPQQVVDLHINWQNRYEDELVRPQVRGSIRDAVSQYQVEEVVSTKRLEVASLIEESLSQKLQENNLSLVDFVIRNITFSPEYAASVEQKQIAEQQAQQARLVVEQRKQEAEQARQVAQGQADAVVINSKGLAEARLIQAEAEAKALDLYAQALEGNNELLTYTYINKLAPGIQVMLVPSSSPFLLPLPEMGPSPATTAAAPAPTAIPLPTPLPILPTPTP
jgi:regulator of protease activity HflC (stomatin/prohibitin superfamily)